MVESAHGFIGATLGNFLICYLELPDCETSYFNETVMVLP